VFAGLALVLALVFGAAVLTRRLGRVPGLSNSAIRTVAAAAVREGFAVLAAAPSGLPGPKGNRETFLHLAEEARGGTDDLDALALRAEPEDAS
jgi:23S rRNA (cytidine1920-2'-O)/16S rRNA (cytidine1409-2'-O)-methyltransferase